MRGNQNFCNLPKKLGVHARSVHTHEGIEQYLNFLMQREFLSLEKDAVRTVMIETFVRTLRSQATLCRHLISVARTEPGNDTVEDIRCLIKILSKFFKPLEDT